MGTRAFVLTTAFAWLLVSANGALVAQGPPQAPAPAQPSALSLANLAKPRPKPPFDLTGMWQHDGRANKWQFVPEKFTLTPEAQVHYDKGVEALKNGGVYRDDIGQCWPAGMPLIMTRVWPIAMVQLPTVIYMISHFENSVRIIYLDGRPHTDPDVVVRTFNGESIGKWEGDTLVVTTKGFETDHHWIDTGLPVSDDFQVIERIRKINKGNTLEIEYIMTDPNNWKGEWRNTKRWDRVLESDIGEVECIDARNANLPGTDRGQATLKANAEEKK